MLQEEEEGVHHSPWPRATACDCGGDRGGMCTEAVKSKRKHVQVHVEHLQHGLLQGQQRPQGPAGLEKPAARSRHHCSDELSLELEAVHRALVHFLPHLQSRNNLSMCVFVSVSNCRRFPVDQIPEDEKECASWLHRLYQEKVDTDTK